MGFEITGKKIRDNEIVFVYEEGAFSGVNKIASRVREDIAAVFGAKPFGLGYSDFRDAADFISQPIFFGTVGKSDILDKMDAVGLISLDSIRQKREVYSFNIINDFKFDDFYFESAVVIAGSDKRGTIYGLFKLSEFLGVSPFIDWLDVTPKKLSSYMFNESDSFISREPSVRYRGFFINDEWPAFGNFCNHNYGGFNAKVYEHVFELLLRLKGNYMWPAMWSAIFPDDGPGLLNEELADELGVVMGMSHHEPCLRQGEEYKYLRGADSIYGDAWNFRTNREGITRFWEDGLKRSGRFENVITVGMRGECDTAIMGKDATLKDNIDLLRDVLKTQNELIRKNVNENLDEVPRMLALYKEVEPYFYGDDVTPGLMGDPELEGVTLMLCDDNYGNLRTVPTQEMRSHKGGYGMYYHFDYHGLPVSFEWFNTSYLPKVWEQMTTAYDFGIRDLWIVNVGDIFTNEYPLSYFLDLAYDFDKWGTSNLNSPKEYTEQFVCRNFKGRADEEELKSITKLLTGYTKITGARRTEAMNDGIYAPFAYGECENLLGKIKTYLKKAKELQKSLPKDAGFAFYELVYLPLTANLNVQRMWLLAAQNHAYAQMGSTYALTLAQKINGCIEKDRELVKKLHEVHNEKWFGMGLSEHIGFKYWCEEECQYPVVHTFEPANKARLIVSIPGSNQHSEGGFWSGRILTMAEFLNPDIQCGKIRVTTAGRESVKFSVSSSSKFLGISFGDSAAGLQETSEIQCEKVTDDEEILIGEAKFGKISDIYITLDREGYDKCIKSGDDCEKVTLKWKDCCVEVRIPINNVKSSYDCYEKNTYIWCGEAVSDFGNTVTGTPSYTRVLPEGVTYKNHIAIEAENFASKHDSASGRFEVIPGYGKTKSAIKAYPQNLSFKYGIDAPYVIYKFVLPKNGEYTVELLSNPTNPCFRQSELYVGISFNNETFGKVNMIPDGFAVGDGNMSWQQGVLDNIRHTLVNVKLREGINTLNVFAISPGLVLEKIVISEKNCAPLASYLGPSETYRVQK